ncbi:hypothetical protein ACTFIY_002704 [Dictyostelium cf. discoideum]
MLNKSHVKISTQDLKEKIKNLKTRIDTLESHVNTKRKKIELQARSQPPVSDESSLQLEKSFKEILLSQGLQYHKGVFDIINGFEDALKNQLINSDISLQDRFKIIQESVDQNSLIGRDIHIPVDQLIDMTAIACGSLIGSKKEFLARDWKQWKTASEDDLKKRIGGAFSDNRINRQLLTSISGEILYEIERLQNKKFAFRVYNAQALLLAKNPEINSQIEPCYGLVHVSEEVLFSSSFFNILAHITTDSFEDAIATVLPMLGGERELIPEGVHQELTKNSFSGFITMKSLLARSLNSTDYRLIKFDFQSISFRSSYIKLALREIEKYRRDQWKIERTIPSEFTAFQYSCPTERLLDRWEIDGITECSNGLSSESVQYIHRIRTELQFGSDTFWPQFFQILQKIAQLETFEAEWISVEGAIKQVPNLKGWESASFQDPAASMGWISRLLSKICTELNRASPPEAFLSIFL